VSMSDAVTVQTDYSTGRQAVVAEVGHPPVLVLFLQEPNRYTMMKMHGKRFLKPGQVIVLILTSSYRRGLKRRRRNGWLALFQKGPQYARPSGHSRSKQGWKYRLPKVLEPMSDGAYKRPSSKYSHMRAAPHKIRRRRRTSEIRHRIARVSSAAVGAREREEESPSSFCQRHVANRDRIAHFSSIIRSVYTKAATAVTDIIKLPYTCSPRST
jgi:hypothetical protein